MHLALLLLFWSFLLQWNSAEKKNERFLWSLKYSLNIGYMPDLRWLMGFRSLRKPMHRCLEWVVQGRLFWFPQKIQCVMYLDHSKIENTHNMLRLAIACHESWTPRGLLLGSSGMDWLEDDKDDWFSAKLLEAFLATNNMPPTKQDLPLPSKSVSGSCWRWKTSLKQQKLWSPPPKKQQDTSGVWENGMNGVSSDQVAALIWLLRSSVPASQFPFPCFLDVFCCSSVSKMI